jgi:hypothetical protein
VARVKDFDAVTEWIYNGTDRPCGPASGWTVGSLIPRQFEVCVRILHRAQAFDPGEGRQPEVRYLTWAQVAEHEGTVLEPDSRFEDLIASQPQHGMPHAGTSTDDRQCHALTGALGKHTASAVGVLLYVCYGWGMPALAEPFTAWLQDEDYLGTEASISSACGNGMDPTIWWPLDRSWIARSPEDCLSTYIGCSAETEEAILAAGVEVVRANRGDEIS